MAKKILEKCKRMGSLKHLSLLRGEVLTEFINSLVAKKCKRREFKSLVIFTKIFTQE